MNKGNTSDLFAIFGMTMKPNYNNNDIAEVFGKSFGDETTVSQENNNGLEIQGLYDATRTLAATLDMLRNYEHDQRVWDKCVVQAVSQQGLW